MSSKLKQPVWIVAIAMIGAIGLTFHWRSAWGKAAADADVGEFRVRSEESLSDDQGQTLLREMLQLQEDVSAALKLRPNGRPMEVNLFATQASYQKYVGEHFPEATNRTAIYVHDDDAGRVMVYQHLGLLDDVRHECTHAVLHHHVKSLPLWLDEGLAEYFEVAREQRLEGNFSLFELQSLIRSGWKPDLSRLENLHDLADLTSDDYLECWAWAHYLLNGADPLRELLQEYVNEAQKKPPIDRLSDRLRSRLSNPETALISHLEHFGVDSIPFQEAKVQQYQLLNQD